MSAHAPAAAQPYLHPRAWTAAQMRERTDWIVRLDARDNDELRAALAHAKARGAGIPSLAAEDFPLPRLAAILRDVRDEVTDGRGFVLLRGLRIDDLGAADAAAIYWGIGAHMGRGRAQNAQGEVLGHVTDIGVDYLKNANARGYQSRLMLPFHNDLTDIVGLLCLAPARSGGASRIVSSTTIHNVLIERHPELAETLYRTFPIDRRGEARDGRAPWYPAPAFERVDGRLFCRYNRTYVESSQRFPDAPRLTPEQHAAMDAVDALCEDPSLTLDMELETGDMQFISNYTVLHSRTAYEDWPEKERRRYLLRLWLDTGRFARIPDSWMERYADLDAWQRTPKPPVFDLSARRADLIH
ncbi:MAG: TauD/TfdA family dioxygenase [Burkholderiales bacterium]